MKVLKKLCRHTGDQRRGFTLIELSISLVIIGLIVGGILGARDMIKQATLRSIITDITEFQTMAHTFKLKYGGWPGDITNASEYWPLCDGTPANCNGNGNGIITEGAEGIRAWQQLTDSGIMPGSYNGVPTSGTDYADIGVNIPAAPIEPGGYAFAQGTGIALSFDRSIIFGKHNGTSRVNWNIINAADAKTIDDKMDDGLAPNGDVRADRNTGDSEGTKCAINAGTDDNYELSDTTRACRMHFRLN